MNKRSWRITLYSCLLYLLAPFVLARLLIRGRSQPGYLKFPQQRFGYGYPKVNAPIIWIHAVSVGETRGSLPLVEALKQLYPTHTLLLTHMTAAGWDTGQGLLGNRVIQCWLPYDLPGACRRFLSHFSPHAGLLLETEIWFNLINYAQQIHTPIFLVNARLSESSLNKYKHFKRLSCEALLSLHGIIAQSHDDAARFKQLGAADICVAGNIKFDISPPDDIQDLIDHFRSLIGNRRIWLAASTREGEEKIILNIAKQLPEGILTIIVPRHPQRFSEVAHLIKSSGFRMQQRNDKDEVEPSTQIWLGNSMGEMYGYYGISDLALIGGSLLPFGGQNLIEAAAVGTPTLVGAYTFNFSQVVQDAIKAGATIQVSNTDEFVPLITELFNTPNKLHKMQIAAKNFTRNHMGATNRIMKYIQERL
ncbi:MAG: 3-deoxy-D-manno-octulosonic acid transferase [Pseudomonadota bacterium]|nr:3-deoxy-D-manno-octulosonic acid transferase [Pseudomonadota bacterium]